MSNPSDLPFEHANAINPPAKTVITPASAKTNQCPLPSYRSSNIGNAITAPRKATRIPITYPIGLISNMALRWPVPSSVSSQISRDESKFRTTWDPTTQHQMSHPASKQNPHHGCAGFLGGWQSRGNQTRADHFAAAQRTNARHLRRKSDWRRSIRQRPVHLRV